MIDFGLKLEKDDNLTNYKTMMTAFDFEPFIMNFLPTNYTIRYTAPKDELEDKKEEMSEKEKQDKKKEDRYLKKKRDIIVTDPNVFLHCF